MIYYPLSTLMMADVRELLIVADRRALTMYEQLFGDAAGVTVDALDGHATMEVGDALGAAAESAYRGRRDDYGAERMAPLERYLLLQTIDDKWKDHLHALDYLRTGVGMRGYGQEDPKIVYRRESASYFQKMIEAVQETVIDLREISDNEVEVSYAADTNLGGELAGFGEKIVSSMAKGLGERFAQNIQERLEGQGGDRGSGSV